MDSPGRIETILEHSDQTEIPNTVVVQRLHPDWRMVPHLNIFGWTERHAQLEAYLRKQAEYRRIGNLYFTSDREYVEAQRRLKNPIKHEFLSRPSVNTVEGILSVLAEDQRGRRSSEGRTEQPVQSMTAPGADNHSFKTERKIREPARFRANVHPSSFEAGRR